MAVLDQFHCNIIHACISPVTSLMLPITSDCNHVVYSAQATYINKCRDSFTVLLVYLYYQQTMYIIHTLTYSIHWSAYNLYSQCQRSVIATDSEADIFLKKFAFDCLFSAHPPVADPSVSAPVANSCLTVTPGVSCVPSALSWEA